MLSGDLGPAIYRGTLRHRRFHPVRHEFTYPLFLAYLDVDQIPELMQVSRWCSYNRWNWASFQESDHLAGPGAPIRRRIAANAAMNGVALPQGRIYLLTHLRYLGHNFNPVSFYYCLEPDGSLGAVLAEVNNTYGETHTYWLDSTQQIPGHGDGRRYRCSKAFHVSPFLQPNLEYDFVVTTPAESLLVNIAAHAGQQQAIFDATLRLERRPWSHTSVRGALLWQPCMTLKVVAGIYWQAWRLHRKGVSSYPKG
jgi:DUF1365 family protein